MGAAPGPTPAQGITGWKVLGFPLLLWVRVLMGTVRDGRSGPLNGVAVL